MFDFDRHRSDPLHTLHIYIFITAFNISSMYSGQLSRSTTYLFLLCFLLLLLLRYTLQTASFFFVWIDNSIKWCVNPGTRDVISE